VVEEHSHLWSGIVGLKNDGMSVLGAMVDVEQFSAEVFKGLYHHISRDDQMRDFMIRNVRSSGIHRLKSHQPEQLSRMRWQQECNGVCDDKDNEDLTFACNR